MKKFAYWILFLFAVLGLIYYSYSKFENLENQAQSLQRKQSSLERGIRLVEQKQKDAQEEINKKISRKADIEKIENLESRANSIDALIAELEQAEQETKVRVEAIEERGGFYITDSQLKSTVQELEQERKNEIGILLQDMEELLEEKLSALSIFNDGEYDPIALPRAGAIEEIQKSVLTLRFEASIQKDGSITSSSVSYFAHGIAISPREILIPAHVYDFTQKGWSIISVDSFLDGHKLNVICRKTDSDIIILNTPPELVLNFYADMNDWGDSSKIRNGDAIIIFGFPWAENDILRGGIISASTPQSKVLKNYLNSYLTSLALDDVFLISIDTVGGDSGSPIFAFLDREMFFVGMVIASLNTEISPASFGIAIKSNKIAENIRIC